MYLYVYRKYEENFFKCKFSDKINRAADTAFLYSVILTEYVRMDPGCLCVCVSVTALQPKWLGRF